MITVLKSVLVKVVDEFDFSTSHNHIEHESVSLYSSVYKH